MLERLLHRPKPQPIERKPSFDETVLRQQVTILKESGALDAMTKIEAELREKGDKSVRLERLRYEYDCGMNLSFGLEQGPEGPRSKQVSLGTAIFMASMAYEYIGILDKFLRDEDFSKEYNRLIRGHVIVYYVNEKGEWVPFSDLPEAMRLAQETFPDKVSEITTDMLGVLMRITPVESQIRRAMEVTNYRSDDRAS